MTGSIAGYACGSKVGPDRPRHLVPPWSFALILRVSGLGASIEGLDLESCAALLSDGYEDAFAVRAVVDEPEGEVGRELPVCDVLDRAVAVASSLRLEFSGASWCAVLLQRAPLFVDLCAP
jgi:hypothetical protein